MNHDIKQDVVDHSKIILHKVNVQLGKPIKINKYKQL